LGANNLDVFRCFRIRYRNATGGPGRKRKKRNKHSAANKKNQDAVLKLFAHKKVFGWLNEYKQADVTAMIKKS